MPLLDHFHPPLSERRPWESFHATWCGALADQLDRDVLPGGYYASEQITPGVSFAVEIHSTEGDRTLVGAIELVSPANKDRPGKRRMFAAKCAAYLGRGAGLVIVDVVTTRRGNLHQELLQTLGIAEVSPFTSPSPLYTVAYRPLRKDSRDIVETWPMPLAVGQALPTVPLSLAADFCVAVNLEAAYQDACSRRRFDEVVV